MSTLWQDVRYGLRMLFKNPGFSAVAVLTLALGIGVNSAIFSVVNAVLLRPLPFNDSERIITLRETLPQGGEGSISVPNLKDWREQNDVFEKIAAYDLRNFNLQNADSPERVSGAAVTVEFFDVLGVAPVAGRAFLSGEDQTNGQRIVILSNALWRRNFGSDPQVIGKSIALNGEQFTVVGVMGREFRFPARTAELWVPLVFTNDQSASRGSHAFSAIGRLKPGVSLDQAQEQMSGIARRIEAQYPAQQAGRNVKLTRLQEALVGYMRPALLVLLGAVAFVLLIACTNVANLLLARALARHREIAIRTALGAGRARLVRQFLTESVLLSFLGGALGLLLAYWGIDGLVALAGNYLPRASEVGLDGRVVGFTLLLSLMVGVLFGLAPALQISKTDVQESLKEGGSAGNSPRRNRLRSALIVAEIASSLVLLVGAGLLIKSFVRLQGTESGLRPENVLTMRLSLPAGKYNTPQARTAFYDQVLERVSALPGVEAAGVINYLPLQQYGFNGEIEVEGQAAPQAGQASPLVEFRAASVDYFRALRIPLVAGRFFSNADRNEAAPVAIVNQTFANRLLPNQDPVGKRIRPGDGPWITIIGVVGDVKQAGLTRSVMPEMFAPVALGPASMTQTMSLAVRATAAPTELTSAVRREIQAVDPLQPIYNVQTMETVISESVSDRRLNMMLLSIFASLALALASIGIYSVMAYMVTQHTREIGIRMALGAGRGDILKLVVGQGMVLALVGVAFGVPAAFALMRFLSSLLFGVSPGDPLTFAVVTLLLLGVAFLACYIPARRAMRTDPMEALRYE